MSCRCINKELKSCYGCLNYDELEIQYDKVMRKSIYERIKYGCGCYMCNDSESCNCYQLSLFYENDGRYDEKIEQKVQQIRRKIKSDNFRLFRTYLLCINKLNKLYETIVEKRFRPEGNGYIEVKLRFEKSVSSIENKM